MTSDSFERRRSDSFGQPIGLRALLTLALAVSSPLAALAEGDPPAGTSVRIFSEALLEQGAVSKVDLDSIRFDASGGPLADAAADLTGVAAPASTEYSYDDGTPEAFSQITGAHEQQPVAEVVVRSERCGWFRLEVG